MKTIQIRKDSWHWWVAKNFGGWKQYRNEDQWELRDGKRWYRGSVAVENDFCSYVRRVLLGSFWLTFLAVVGTVALGLFSYVEYCLIRDLIHGTWTKEAGLGATLLTIIVGAGTVVGVLIYLDHTRSKRRERNKERREARAIEKLKNKDRTSFLKHAYASLKDKMCFQMEVK